MFVVWCSQDIWFWVYSRFEAVRRLCGLMLLLFDGEDVYLLFIIGDLDIGSVMKRCVVVLSVSHDFCLKTVLVPFKSRLK
jgi:hypothetical protein